MKIRIATLLLLVALIVGCGQKRSVVGTWNVTYASLPAVVNFKPDGTFTVDVKQGEMKANVSGTYTVEDDKLSIVGTDISTEGIPEAIASTVRESAKKSWNRTGTMKWKSDDEFQYSEGDEALTFERDKPAG